MEGLMSKLQDPGQRQNYAWMRMRIERMWKNWEDAVKNLASKQDLSNRRQKKVTAASVYTSMPIHIIWCLSGITK